MTITTPAPETHAETGPRVAVRSLAFLTPGNYDDDAPAVGLDETLALFEHGEALGFDGAWVRQRHLEHGISSAVVFLAAASQRTRRLELGTAVIPIGYESPFRLAEDLSTLDVLSGGRVQAGFSAGTPPHADLIGERVFDADWRSNDFSHARIERLLDNLRGDFLGDGDTVIHSPGNTQRPRLQPYSPGLAGRLWYGGGSLGSAEWAGRHGLGLLVGNIVAGETSDDFATAQRAVIDRYRRAAGDRVSRIALGRVIVPTDSADRATRAKYREYAASRYERTLAPHGERRTLFARDLIGPADEIAEALAADAALAEVDELRIELPYEFGIDDYRQIIADVAGLVAPQLGWTPAEERA